MASKTAFNLHTRHTFNIPTHCARVYTILQSYLKIIQPPVKHGINSRDLPNLITLIKAGFDAQVYNLKQLLTQHGETTYKLAVSNTSVIDTLKNMLNSGAMHTMLKSDLLDVSGALYYLVEYSKDIIHNTKNVANSRKTSVHRALKSMSVGYNIMLLVLLMSAYVSKVDSVQTQADLRALYTVAVLARAVAKTIIDVIPMMINKVKNLSRSAKKYAMNLIEKLYKGIICPEMHHLNAQNIGNISTSVNNRFK